MEHIYADYNATSPLCEASKSAMIEALEYSGNPSSIHQWGRRAKSLLEGCRVEIASKLGVVPQELVFTSGGSEANTLALWGSFFSSGKEFRCFSTPIEHSSILESLSFLEKRGGRVNLGKVSAQASLELESFERDLAEYKPTLVSVMAANNETGSLFPIPEISALCKKQKIPLHVDAVQALGKVPPELWNQADLISVSAHKVGGPKGCGALVVRPWITLLPTHFGGSQETKRRGGTENLLGIVGFAGACRQWPISAMAELETERNRFEKSLQERAHPIFIQSETTPRLPNTSNVRFVGIRSEVLLSALDLDGIAVSAGSACSSGSVTPSHVLLAMGLTPEAARECVRFSFGPQTTRLQMDRIVERVVFHVQRIRSRT